ncbi:MAG: hypothetical protein FWC20_10270 [Oscillospiraceae bacterium]|nr:hypothetical protein [Oscillospiraceae bacterium]MCL2279773.1 hypothetical protein [Oscillospiraceae bacterium]
MESFLLKQWRNALWLAKKRNKLSIFGDLCTVTNVLLRFYETLLITLQTHIILL